MADGDPMDISALLAPWMSSNVWDPSTYGGGGNFGAAMLAAAGPTPYKQPFLAALGKGMQMGQANALNTAQARMGLVGNSIAMQRQLAMLPYQLSYLRMLQQQSAGDTSSAPTDSGSTGTTSQDSTPSASGAQGAAPLTGPPGNLVSQYSQPSAPWADPSSSGAATPPGVSTPSPVSSSSAATAGLDPFRSMRLAAFGGAMGMPGAQQLTDLGKAQLEYNPGVATGMALAKDPLTLDRAMISDALSRGDRNGAQAAYFKYLKDAGMVTVDRYGNVTTLGGISPNSLGVNTFLPAQGFQTTGGVASPIPGMLPTRQALAGAESVGKAQGELTEVVDPRTHQSYFVPKSTLLGGGGAAAPGAASPGAGGASGGSAPLAALSPGQREFLQERGKEGGNYLGELQKGADAATTANYAIDQMVADARGAQLGPGAPAREFVERSVASLGQQFGISPPKELASYEALDKYGNQLGMAASRALGSREAAQIVQLAIRSNPNKELVPEAFANIAQSMRAMNAYVIAKNTALQGVSGSDNASALQMSATWTQRIDPRVWDLSLGPELAAAHATNIGVPKIATAIPVMATDDAVSVIRNLSPTMRGQVIARLPAQVKQEILESMQDAATAPRGVSGSW